MITIITATYNAQALLPDLIASLRSQTDRSFEWVVVDGASTDATVELLKSADDVLTRWVSEPDFGVYHALNKALQMARGDYYLIVGADDCLDRRAIENFSRAAAESKADVISAPVLVDGKKIEPRRRMPWVRSGPPLVSAHSVGSLIKRSLHREIGLYSNRYPIAADTYFLLQVWRRDKQFAYLPQTVGTFGTTGLSSGDTLGALCESFRANVEVRGRLFLHVTLLLARIIANRARIAAGLKRHSPQ